MIQNIDLVVLHNVNKSMMTFRYCVVISRLY